MAAVDLLFSHAPVTGTPVNLVFGASEDAAVAATELTLSGQLSQPGLSVLILAGPVVQLDAVGTLAQPPLTCALDLRYIAALSLHGLLPEATLTAACDAQYLTNTARPTVGQVAAMAQVAQPVESGITHAQQDTQRTSAGTAALFSDGAGAGQATHVAFTDGVRTAQSKANGFQDGVQISRTANGKFQEGSPDRREFITGRVQDGLRAQAPRMQGRFQDGMHDRRPQVNTRWQSGVGHLFGYQGKAGPAQPRPMSRSAKFQEGVPPPPGVRVPIVIPPGVTPPSLHLVFACPPLAFPHLVFGAQACDTVIVPGITFSILPARFYMTTHNIYAQRLPDLAEIPIFDSTVSADSGSYCWTLQASGPASLFELLAPVNGLPVQLRITMDGIPWVFAVDALQRNQAFGKTGVSISGRSVTALIGAPYLRAITRDNAGESRLAQQLALDALQYTGVDLDWGLTDWLVPAGAWSHQGTPLDAVQAIASAAGGYLQSHRSAPTLLTRHPYGQRQGDNPGAPWGWMTGPADVELAPDAIITDGTERKDGADINAIYVSGTTQGVLAQVKRTGTAGDKLAAMVTDALITHTDAARQRGLAVLGAAGAKYNVRFELPVLTGLNQPGVLDVGQLVQVNAATPWRGRVRAVSVNAKRPSLRQSVTLERHLEIA